MVEDYQRHHRSNRVGMYLARLNLGEHQEIRKGRIKGESKSRLEICYRDGNVVI